MGMSNQAQKEVAALARIATAHRMSRWEIMDKISQIENTAALEPAERARRVAAWVEVLKMDREIESLRWGQGNQR